MYFTEEQLKEIKKQEKEIDKYIEGVVKKIGYIPMDCKDENIEFDACVGCGLCKGTNPIQLNSCMKEFEEYPLEYCEFCRYNNHDPEVGIFNQCTRNQWE
jgi:hypothetical protein